jgi:hypothetical protein
MPLNEQRKDQRQVTAIVIRCYEIISYSLQACSVSKKVAGLFGIEKGSRPVQYRTRYPFAQDLEHLGGTRSTASLPSFFPLLRSTTHWRPQRKTVNTFLTQTSCVRGGGRFPI